MPGFVHLHVHSSYSLLEGALTIARLGELAKADRQPALALTDTDNLFGALEFSDKLAGHGIQPIIGCALAIDFGDQDLAPRNGPSPARPRMVFLAAREDGYRSLMRLNSRAFLDTAPNEQPHLKLPWLEGEAAGLIALSGGPGGPLDMAFVAGQANLANDRCAALTASVWRSALYRAATSRHRERADDRARPPGDLLTRRASRLWQPTSRSSRTRRIMRRTMRSSASPRGACSWIPNGVRSRLSINSSLARR